MTTFSIPDMSCGHCKAAIEKTIAAVDPKAELEFDMTNRRVRIDSHATEDRLRDALQGAGYPVAG
jgi:copper chaperone